MPSLPKKLILSLLFLSILAFLPLSSQADESATGNTPSCPEEGMEGTSFLLFKGPLVPCGVKTACKNSFGNDISVACTVCHLFILLKNLLDLLTSLLIIVSLVTITIGGLMYTVSSGNSKMVSLAKNLITKTLIGFGIFLLSWLIVYTVLKFVSFNFGAVNSGSWWKIECDTRSYFSGIMPDSREDIPNKNDGTDESSSPGTGGTTEPTRPLDPIDSAKEKEVRDLLAAEGIGINNPPCTTTRRSNCTNVAGMKQETIQGIIDLKRKCNCEVIVTGGTEPGHSSAHTNGSKADFRSHYFDGKPSGLTNYIVRDKKFGEKIGVRPGNYGGDIYRDGDNYYVKEGNHWDVCFNCTCATTASGSCQYPRPK